MRFLARFRRPRYTISRGQKKKVKYQWIPCPPKIWRRYPCFLISNPVAPIYTVWKFPKKVQRYFILRFSSFSDGAIHVRCKELYKNFRHAKVTAVWSYWCLKISENLKFSIFWSNFMITRTGPTVVHVSKFPTQWPPFTQFENFQKICKDTLYYDFQAFQMELYMLGVKNFTNDHVVAKLQPFKVIDV